MQYCPLCQVQVAGNKRCCPLCRGKLVGEPDAESEIFPQVVPPYKRVRAARRILTLCVLIVIACCLQVESVWKPSIRWPMFVIAAALCSWLAIMLGISRRRLLMQNLAAQTLLFCTLSVLWDVGTGWRGWSLDWVFPILCIGGQGALWILKFILRVPMVEAVAWTGILATVGWLIPFCLLLFEQVHILLPSIVCASLSFIILVLLILFFHRYMREEAVRRFHL